MAALFALDARLGDVLRTVHQPLAVQMRLAWWRDALAALDERPPPAEPVLAALARDVLPLGVRGAELVAIVDGWEQLLAEPFDRAAMTAFAAGRGGALFEQAARLLGGRVEGVAAAGEGWALADIADRMGDAAVTAEARLLARTRLEIAPQRWPRVLRPLGALVLLARSDLGGGRPGSPRRIARLLVHRLTGR